MNNTIHPYLKYAYALILMANNLTDCQQITAEHLTDEINKGLDSFRVKPSGIFNAKENVNYTFCNEEEGKPEKGIFLSPNVIALDKRAKKDTWGAAVKLIGELQENKLTKNADLAMSVVPTAGEFLSFSLKGGIGRGKPKGSLLERGLGIVTTLTRYKPCFNSFISTEERANECLIPDLPIDKTIDFISFFKRMLVAKTSSDLMTGNVEAKPQGRGKNKTVKYKPKRPLIFNGNFPNPPRSSAMGGIALLGAIGEFAKEAQYSEQAKRVLDSLKDRQMYLIRYGNATVFIYNHYVIDLAKESKLKSIVDSLYYAKLYSKDRRAGKDTEYRKFDLFANRFLQLFNRASFKDFLAFRAEYPAIIKTLFTTYFIKMEKINPEIVKSARVLGKWLNKVAYFAAKNEIKEKPTGPKYWEELRKVKAKFLVELESSTFSSKTGNALIAQAVTRAGRLSGMDAPEGAALFMEKTASGELPLDDAKNLLIAFSRLINKSEKSEKSAAGISPESDDDEDLSNE